MELWYKISLLIHNVEVENYFNNLKLINLSWDKLKEILKSTDVKALEKESVSNISKEEKEKINKK